MQNIQSNESYAQFKLAQARDALGDAEGLMANDAAPGFIMNSLFFAFYYPVIALLRALGMQSDMQSIAISLFDREYIETGIIDRRFSTALRRTFELKPACSDDAAPCITREEIEQLIGIARDFIALTHAQLLGQR